MENKNIILLRKRCRTTYAEQCATYEDYVRIDVTSCNRDPKVVADLSPLYIGPVTASDGVSGRSSDFMNRALKFSFTQTRGSARSL